METVNWNTLVEDVAPGLLRYFSACFIRNKAEDCVQETLIRLFQKIQEGKYNPALGNHRMYAYGIAHYVKLESRKYGGKFEVVEDLEFLAEETQNPHETLAKKRQIQDLRKAMSTLSDVQQGVLQLYMDQNLSLEQIGELLGLSVNTVKSHIHRSKEKLKEILSKNSRGIE